MIIEYINEALKPAKYEIIEDEYPYYGEIPAIQGVNSVEKIEALGVIESFSVASLVEAADQAVKTAKVQILELRLAIAIGGKGFVTLCGDVAAVTSAVNTGASYVAQKGLLVNKVVIPQPRPEILREYI